MNSTDNLIGTSRSSSLQPERVVDNHGVLKQPPLTSTPTRIIAITGYARSGKDTVTEMLIKIFAERGENWERLSLAAPLKEMLKVGLGLDDKDERAEELYGCNYRKLAQTLGTEWGRDLICEDIWIRIAAQRAQGKNVIISDLRMENEADWVRKAGGIVVHLERKDLERIAESSHKTEAGIAVHHCDYKILNNWSIRQLYDTCTQVADDLKGILDHKLAWGLEEEQMGQDQLGILIHSATNMTIKNISIANQSQLDIATPGEPELEDIAGWNLEAYYAKHGTIGDCATQCNRRTPAMTDPTCGKCQTMRKEKAAEQHVADLERAIILESPCSENCTGCVLGEECTAKCPTCKDTGKVRNHTKEGLYSCPDCQ